MARKTKTEAARTRSAILDAAEIEMESRGVSGASFQRIAQRAHVTRGAIYWHFDGRDSLLAAMVARTYLPLRDLQHCLRSEQPEQRPETTLQQMLLHGLNRLATDAHHRRVCHIMTHCCEHINDDHPVAALLREGFEESRSVVTGLLREAGDAGQLQPHVSPDDASDMIMAFMCGVYHCSLRYPDLYATRRDWEPMLDALLSGLFAPADNAVPASAE